MRILLIHPQDDLLEGPWAGLAWDRIVDLGLSGEEGYRKAAQRFRCPVSPLDALRGENFQEIRRVRDLLLRGTGRLTDTTGLDWWELTAILVHLQLETIVLLRKFIRTVGPGDEVYVSQPCLQAEVLQLSLGSRLHVFPSRRAGRGPRHYFRVLRKFPPRQLLEIFWDKVDAGYQVRGALNTKHRASSVPVVLLPSSYVNVSKTGISYAKVLPDMQFLLLVTRRSGWIDDCPANVSRAWLRSYSAADRQVRRKEWLDLVERWRTLREELEGTAEFEMLSRVGCFDEFPVRFARGLEIRDAWRNVLDREPVQSVLCADDSNPYTHIPLLLAAQRNLPSINCHHGALDGRYMFKRGHADVTLAKGRMEQDYLVRVCGVFADRVEVGAPAAPPIGDGEHGPNPKSAIVFFSEVYEVSGGRARDFYEDILPRLADLAISTGKELIIKLHPSESVAERTKIVNRVLGPDRRQVARVLDGGITNDLWNRAWFCVTVLSTVAVECALRGVPCFLCAWLESWPYGYVEQFSRFGAGIRLSAASELERIPVLLREYTSSPTLEEDLASRIEAPRLRAWLTKGPEKNMVSVQQHATGC